MGERNGTVVSKQALRIIARVPAYGTPEPIVYPGIRLSGGGRPHTQDTTDYSP